MSRDDTAALFATRRDLLRRHDPAGLAAMHTEDGLVLSPLLGSVRGRAAIEQSYHNLFETLPDIDIPEDGHLLVDGDAVVQIFRATGSQARELLGMTSSGRKFEVQAACRYQMRGRLIAHELRIYDFTALLLQVGVLKARPA